MLANQTEYERDEFSFSAWLRASGSGSSLYKSTSAMDGSVKDASMGIPGG